MAAPRGIFDLVVNAVSADPPMDDYLALPPA
jgi:hypothetical protein